MALKVIGAGFGRTGTVSFKLAMEHLGFTKCHHMKEVLDNPEQAAGFLAAAQMTEKGEPVDWDALYEGYQACCDWPSCYFWRELAAYYPEAKVVLTLRDTQSWYRSMSETILPTMGGGVGEFDNPTTEMGEVIVRQGSFGGNIADKAHVMAAYDRHNQAVRDTIPAERLLEFEAKQGWEPLCAFLGVPVPDRPYPKTNSLEDFHQIVAEARERMAEDK